ncbi:MAG: hypothetical protein Q9227_001040 [Pyrenula ochraceoflavens]
MAAQSRLRDPEAGKLEDVLAYTRSIGLATSVAVHPPSSVISSSTGIASSSYPLSRTTAAANESADGDDESSDFSSRRSSAVDSDIIPALTRGTSVASNDSRASSISGPPLSAVTELASFFSTHPLLEESESDPGVLTLPATRRPPADYTCPFHVLDCMETFEEQDLTGYKCHVLSHFRGRTPPSTAKCPLCEAAFRDPEPRGDGSSSSRRTMATGGIESQGRAWDDMLTHLANAHFGQGERLKTARPDFDLYTWMWKQGIIATALYKSLQLEDVIPFGRNNERRDGRAVIRANGQVVVPPSAPSPPPLARQSVGRRDEPFTVHMSHREENRARRRRAAGRPSF